MADQHDELARLLEHARTDAPSEPVLSEVRKRVLNAIAAGTTAEAGLTQAASESLRAGAGAAWLLKLGTGALVLGLLLTAYFTLLPSPSPSPSPSPALSPMPMPMPMPMPVPMPTPSPAVEGPAPEAPSLPVPAPKPDKPRRLSRPAPQPAAPLPAPAPAPNASFAEEVALLKAALAAQRAGNKDEARAKLDEHTRRFPNGQLISERKRIEARLAQ